jgi:hypothetical protein
VVSQEAFLASLTSLSYGGSTGLCVRECATGRRDIPVRGEFAILLQDTGKDPLQDCLSILTNRNSLCSDHGLISAAPDLNPGEPSEGQQSR